MYARDPDQRVLPCRGVRDDDEPETPAADRPLDVVVPRAPTPDGKGVQVVRLRESAVEVGEVRPLAEGQPIQENADVVKLSPRSDVPAYNVEVIVPRRSRRSASTDGEPPRALKGPAQVATDEYRRNWLAIFGEPLAEEPVADESEDAN